MWFGISDTRTEDNKSKHACLKQLVFTLLNFIDELDIYIYAISTLPLRLRFSQLLSSAHFY